ncbi:MAG: B12-binding domain-containing radical SAM protein [Actinobacteria bacterium]|nr:B12-binding domain-containing radical SAM protein [Actinomycetota bacterium]
MKKILIVNPPFYRLQNASLVHYPPGCCMVAAVLEKIGYAPVIYNADYDPDKKTILGNTDHLNVNVLTRQYNDYLKRLNGNTDPIWKEIKNYLKEYNPDVLVVSVFNTTLTAGNKIAKMAKELNPKVITIFEGMTNRGLHCAIDPSTAGDFSVMDYAIRKEPELTIMELMKAIEKGLKDFSKIKGISYKKNGKVVHNPDRMPLMDLDKLPFPGRHLLDGSENMPPHTFQGIYGSRGCPFQCIFCGCHTSMGYKPRVRSAESMIAEIEDTYKKFGTRYFYICDDIFFIDKKRAQKFCQILMKKKLPIYWSAQTRAEMVDEKTLRMAKKAGCQHIAVGVEVGNPEIRKLIKKGNLVEDVRRCAELIHKVGLRMVAFCIIGLPGEGRQEITDTVNLVKEIKPYIVYPYFPTPASGTELASILEKENPQGIAEYRDRNALDASAPLVNSLNPKERKELIAWAIGEFVNINKHNLVLDVMMRPKFYWALANDMNFFKHPQFFLGYIKDYLNV